MNSILEVAKKAAKEAGIIVGDHFEKSLSKEWKEDMSPVTVADKKADDLIVKIIKENFPDHSILAEESGESVGEGEHQWVVDAIDGTANFSNGIPVFAISIGVVKDNEPVVGVMYNPVTDSLFHAEKGKGAFWNDNPMHVSDDTPDRATVTFGYGQGEREFLDKLLLSVRGLVRTKRLLGCAAIELAYLARGGTEGFFCLNLNKWDYAAGVLLVQEAGGNIVTLEGGEWKFGENSFIASNSKEVEEKLLEAVRLARS